MLKILSRITGRNRDEIRDAGRIYEKAMAQSRDPGFYGPDLCEDTTDGRMEILYLHLSTIMYVLRMHGDTGAKLNQAIYDVMVEDFDVALREEGLSDTGVSRRIKPLAKVFFTRVKQYSDIFDDKDNNNDALSSLLLAHVCKTGNNTKKFTDYMYELLENLKVVHLGQIAKAAFEFPKFH